MDKVMIRVRYRDLPPGLNGDALREGDDVVVYFAPGLTGQQRKAALRRLRQAASRGQKPPLPTLSLARALAADRLRAKVSTLAAIVRLHPAGTLVPALGLAALLGVFLLTSVSVHILQSPPAADRPSVIGGGPPPSITGRPASHGHRTVPVGRLRASSGGAPTTQSTGLPASLPSVSSQGSGSPAGGSSGGGTPPGVPGGTPGGSGAPGGGPGSVAARASAGSVLHAGVAVTTGGGGSPPGICLDAGPLGICLSL